MRNTTTAPTLLPTGRAISAAAVATALLAVSLPAHAQSGSGPNAAQAVPVVAIVRVAKPWYAPRALVASKMRKTIPEYEQLPGLAFKAFSFERESGDFGGVYLWRDLASAQAWFNPAWIARVRKERGADAQIRYFEAPVSLDNTPGGTPADADSAAVSTLVEIALPAGLTRERLVAEFAAALPTYQKVPGLLRKHFIVSSTSNTFGGVYLWKDEASAKAWFNETWHARIRKGYGQDARIEWFDTPILVPTQNAANAIPADALLVAAP